MERSCETGGSGDESSESYAGFKACIIAISMLSSRAKLLHAAISDRSHTCVQLSSGAFQGGRFTVLAMLLPNGHRHGATPFAICAIFTLEYCMCSISCHRSCGLLSPTHRVQWDRYVYSLACALEYTISASEYYYRLAVRHLAVLMVSFFRPRVSENNAD